MENEKKSNGALVGLIVIIIILVLGGVYVWQSKKAEIEEKNALMQKQIEENRKENTSIIDDLEKDLSNIETEAGIDLETIK